MHSTSWHVTVWIKLSCYYFQDLVNTKMGLFLMDCRLWGWVLGRRQPISLKQEGRDLATGLLKPANAFFRSHLNRGGKGEICPPKLVARHSSAPGGQLVPLHALSGLKLWKKANISYLQRSIWIEVFQDCRALLWYRYRVGWRKQIRRGRLGKRAWLCFGS